MSGPSGPSGVDGSSSSQSGSVQKGKLATLFSAAMGKLQKTGAQEYSKLEEGVHGGKESAAAVTEQAQVTIGSPEGKELEKSIKAMQAQVNSEKATFNTLSDPVKNFPPGPARNLLQKLLNLDGPWDTGDARDLKNSLGSVKLNEGQRGDVKNMQTVLAKWIENRGVNNEEFGDRMMEIDNSIGEKKINNENEKAYFQKKTLELNNAHLSFNERLGVLKAVLDNLSK